MVATFILTRTFTISALLVGAARVYAAPIPMSRLCGFYSCLNAVDPVPETPSPSPAVDTTNPTIIEIVEVTSDIAKASSPSVDLEDAGSSPTPKVIELISSPSDAGTDTSSLLESLNAAVEGLATLD